MTEHKFDSNDYNHILDVLDKRAKNIKRYVLFSVCFALVISSVVAILGYNIYKNPSSPIANAISSTIDAGKQEQTIKLFNSMVSSMNEAQGDDSKNKNNNIANNKKVNSTNDTGLDTKSVFDWLPHSFFYKSTSEKIAESISSVIVTFGILMFIGFALRAILVFIKYYMQLGTDFDNQKIAFMLSKGDENLFSKNLSTLRGHNINFEKTPRMPQGEIIDKVIELSKSVRGDSGKT